MKFTPNDAKVLLEIIEKSRTIAEAIDRASQIYPKFRFEITKAIENLFVEKRVEIDERIIREWRKFSGGLIRLSELDEKIRQFCRAHKINEARFREWFEGVTTIKPKVEITAESLARYINYLRISRIIRRTRKAILVVQKEILGYVYKRIIYLNKGRGIIVKINEDKSEITVEANEKPMVLAPVVPLAEKATILTTREKFEFSKEEIGYDAEIRLFDSKWEETLYRSLVGLGAMVQRDIALDVGDNVFVVDFSVCARDKCVFVELVGYWRESYIVNKEIKIRRALDRGYEVWIVCHEKLRDRLKHLTTKKYFFRTKKDLASVAKEIVEELTQ